MIKVNLSFQVHGKPGHLWEGVGVGENTALFLGWPVKKIGLQN